MAAVRPQRAQRPTKVLIVDDVEDNRQIYAMFLRFQGFEVTAVADGLDALETAVTEIPDVVVMDLAIPGIDGWEATRRLKRHRRTRAVPVIVLTGHALAGSKERAKEAGCDAFLTKPCLPEDLAREIRRVLKFVGRKRKGKAR